MLTVGCSHVSAGRIERGFDQGRGRAIHPVKIPPQRIVVVLEARFLFAAADRGEGDNEVLVGGEHIGGHLGADRLGRAIVGKNLGSGVD